jgi:phage-related protein
MPLTFPFTPSNATGGETTYQSQSIAFGDGYKQRVATTINNRRLTINAQFKDRTADEISRIEAFIAALDGVRAFSWNPPPPYNWMDAPEWSAAAPYVAGEKARVALATSGTYAVYAALTTTDPDDGPPATGNADWQFIGTAPLLFICGKNQWSYDDFNRTSLTATFEQVYE